MIFIKFKLAKQYIQYNLNEYYVQRNDTSSSRPEPLGDGEKV